MKISKSKLERIMRPDKHLKYLGGEIKWKSAQAKEKFITGYKKIFQGFDYSMSEELKKSLKEELLAETDEEIDNLDISDLNKHEMKLRRDNYWVSTIVKDEKEGMGLWSYISYETIYGKKMNNCKIKKWIKK